ncbi:MAG: TIGR00730 family Rossman fold protein [Acidobacteria bacterium]|nr:TIGR00730 family Rossman fold protein [Acidobacteriota bacterium]
MKRVCVYGGARSGARPEYTAAARELARAIVERGLGLVNGGGGIGLMGVMANEVLALDGEVTGVIPTFMENRELAHQGLTSLHVVDTMHQRKERMIELSDALVAIPGGVGTLDEFYEAVTWRGLGLHDKPCGLLNVEGYFDAQLAFLARAVTDGFVDEATVGGLAVASTGSDLLDRLGF